LYACGAESMTLLKEFESIPAARPRTLLRRRAGDECTASTSSHE
jgi:hypothetical protein